MTTTTNKPSYYDVTINKFFDGYEKSTVNRVYSNSKLQAITDAVIDELQTLDDQEVIDTIAEQNKSGLPFVIEDGVFSYSVGAVVELEEHKIVYKDEVRTVLLPKQNIYDNTKRYFAD